MSNDANKISDTFCPDSDKPLHFLWIIVAYVIFSCKLVSIVVQKKRLHASLFFFYLSVFHRGFVGIITYATAIKTRHNTEITPIWYRLNTDSHFVYPTWLPFLTGAETVVTTSLPSALTAERIIPCDSMPIILRGGKLAIKSTCLPTRTDGSG